jgi:hypothetical protein
MTTYVLHHYQHYSGDYFYSTLSGLTSDPGKICIKIRHKYLTTFYNQNSTYIGVRKHIMGQISRHTIRGKFKKITWNIHEFSTGILLDGRVVADWHSSCRPKREIKHRMYIDMEVCLSIIRENNDISAELPTPIYFIAIRRDH